ncbi:hypothetical protein A4U42_07665 [Dickeya solani IPO 2222]|nr:hypothetical protein A4U42_07665 [Dickeya solani IPO 2222]
MSVKTHNLIAIDLINGAGQASPALSRRYPDPASVSCDDKKNTVVPVPVVKLCLLEPIIEEHAIWRQKGVTIAYPFLYLSVYYLLNSLNGMQYAFL